MIDCIPRSKKLTFLLFLFTAFSFKNISAQDGKTLFQSNCGTCHSLYKKGAGPALAGFESRGPWADRQKLYDWVHNPAAFIATDPYTQGLLAEYKSMMLAFPGLTNEQIDQIADWINSQPPTPPPPGGPGGGGISVAPETGPQNAVLFGVISLILAIIALVLMYVNSNLKKMSDDKEGIQRPDPVPFYRNKVYIAMFSIFFFVVGGYYLAKGAVGLGRQIDYQPEQPIFYSHKVHAGINQISCLYCHGNAMESKHAAIPSTNVCMNCHKAITTYSGPQLYRENGEQVDGTSELEKLFEYAGFDSQNPNSYDPAKAKPIPWTKIHNLPDHVYFNHAQHVNAGNQQCQTCHGNIQEMDEVFQASELSMGWCVNCHRETKVNFFNAKDSSGNKFYSIYERFHNDMKHNRMDSVTVKDIGGLECQKCHY